MTDMGVTKSGTGSSGDRGPRWADCPLEPRVRQLERDMAVVQSDMDAVQEDVKAVPDLASAVSGLKTHIKISWAITMVLIAAIIGGAVVIWYGGTP